MNMEEKRTTGDTFIEKAQALSDHVWQRYCRIGGVILGLLGGVGLFLLPETPTFEHYKFIAVALLMLLVPRYVENKAQRDVTPGRMAMIAVFAAELVIVTIVTTMAP